MRGATARDCPRRRARAGRKIAIIDGNAWERSRDWKIMTIRHVGVYDFRSAGALVPRRSWREQHDAREKGGFMIRVLLADDHEVVRAGLRLLVEAQTDMEVVGEAANGEEAVTCVRALQPDVAVIDLTMPGIGGLGAARRLRDEGGHTKVVVLTRHEDNAYVRELMAAGTCAYVLKHSGSAELLDAIRSAARNELYVDAALPRRATNDGGLHLTNPRASNRERDVLRLTAIGYTNKEIAARLNISVRTVEVHKTHGMRKLQLAGRADVVRYAARHGWLKDL